MVLFKQKYRIKSARLPGWDYAAAGWYFVTICTRERRCCFGDVVSDTVHLSIIGKIVAEEWLKTERIRSGVKLDQWVIMPNHLHGIVILEGNEPPQRGGSTLGMSGRVVATSADVNRPPRRGGSTLGMSGWKPNSLGAIMGQFKSASTKRIWTAGYRDFSWQARFYDHIIRDERSLHDIREYIINNPMKWELDKDNPENLYM